MEVLEKGRKGVGVGVGDELWRNMCFQCNPSSNNIILSRYNTIIPLSPSAFSTWFCPTLHANLPLHHSYSSLFLITLPFAWRCCSARWDSFFWMTLLSYSLMQFFTLRLILLGLKSKKWDKIPLITSQLIL